MGTHRTGGMTAIGILNIIFGGLGTLIAGLVVLVGGLFAAGGARMASQMGEETQGAGALAAAGGGIMIVIGLIGMACWALLVVSGIGILKMAPWGRVLALICGAAGLLLNGASLVMSDFSFNIITIGAIVYCGLLVYLFMKPDWKAAYTGTNQHGTVDPVVAEQYRHAA